MSGHNRQAIEVFYALIRSLPCLDHQTPRKQLPRNGVYVFLEQGEPVRCLNMVTDRVVRVGTHRTDSRFRSRIRQHYGNVRSLRGNKNASVFRKHLGGALLKRSTHRTRAWKIG